MSREPRCRSVPKDPGTEWEGPRGGRAVGWEGDVLGSISEASEALEAQVPGTAKRVAEE